MVPVLNPMNRSPGTPLIKQMPLIIMPYKAIGIIHQTSHGLIMKCLAVTGASDPVIQSHQLLGILQVSVFFFSCPFFQTPCPLLRYIHYIPIWDPSRPRLEGSQHLSPQLQMIIVQVHPSRASRHPGFPDHHYIPQERYSCPYPQVPSSPDIRSVSLPPWSGSAGKDASDALRRHPE